MKKNWSAAFATLELAMIITAVGGVCLGAIALVDYLNRVDVVYRSLEREIHNSSVSAARIVRDAATAEFSIVTNEGEIRAFVDRVAEKALGSSVEVAYALVDIDPLSGALNGVRPPEYRATRGSSPPLSRNCPGLEAEILRYAGNQQVVPSILAIPDAGSSQRRYLKATAIVVARSEVDFTDAPITGRAMSVWGLNPIVSLCAAAALRGELSGGDT